MFASRQLVRLVENLATIVNTMGVHFNMENV